MHLGQWRYLCVLADIWRHDKSSDKGPCIKGVCLCVRNTPEWVFNVNESIKVIATILHSSPDARKKSLR